jgi:hypothetical protein
LPVVSPGGPCAQCEHFRRGSSIARSAYAVLLPEYRPKLKQAEIMNLQAESQALGIAQQELDPRLDTTDDQLGMQWLSRPVHPNFTYCGLEEFEGRSLKCEVKNPDQKSCPDFTPRAVEGAPRPCTSCRHNRPPLSHPVRVLEETFRRNGQRSSATLDEEIRNVVQSQAEGEYQDCVEQAGFLAQPPAFLPLCLVRRSAEPMTGEQRSIVGPVVNNAGRCSEWSPGQGPSGSAEAAQLDALVAHVRGIVGQAEAVAYMDPLQMNAARRLQANAEAALVARCLAMLGATPDHIAAVCNSFTQAFGEPWNPQLSAQIEASAPRLAPTAPPLVGPSQPGAPAVGPAPQQPPEPAGDGPSINTRGRTLDPETARGLQLLERGEIEEGQRVLRAAAVTSKHAERELRFWIFGHNDVEGLRQWIDEEPEGDRREFLKSALISVADGARANGIELIGKGQVAEGEDWLRRASIAGSTDAYNELWPKPFRASRQPSLKPVVGLPSVPNRHPRPYAFARRRNAGAYALVSGTTGAACASSRASPSAAPRSRDRAEVQAHHACPSRIMMR